MPTSNSIQISAVLDLVGRIRPRSVLDVGIGYGRYGYLCRDLLDNARPGRDRFPTRDEWEVRIDGIEGFPSYLAAGQAQYYDSIRIGDARKLLPTLTECSYELILAIDVLEHFSKQEGWELLHQMKRIAKWTILATPKYFIPQEDAFGNALERHQSVWSRFDLRRAGARTFVPVADHHVALICGNDTANYYREFLCSYAVHARISLIKALLPDRSVLLAQRLTGKIK